MSTRMRIFLLIGAILAADPQIALGYDFTIGKHIDILLKGDLTYTLRTRAEKRDPELASLASGDSNFEKGDIVNNKVIGRWELQGNTSHFTLFGRGELFYDDVFNDDRFSWETRRHAEYNFYDGMEYYLEGRFGTFRFRAGRQVVNWGESIAPVFAVAVNTISPFFGSKVAAAGYTFRDYQVPTHLLWLNYEATPTISLEAVWQPDFDPRYAMPVVGTYGSFSDAFGFGQDGSVDDRRPKRFKDQQQGGVALPKVFPSLANLELGLYYYHHLDRSPSLNFDLKTMSRPVATYEEINMYGLSFSQRIEAWDLGLQLNGELAYRPNDTLQRDLIVLSPFLAHQLGLRPGDSLGPIGGFERGKTLNWVLGGSRLFSDVLRFTPWVFTLTSFFEFYGSVNLDYDEEENFSDPNDTYYYFVSLPLSSADLIDNSTVTLGFDATGNLHQEQRSLHRLSGSLKLKYGDHIEALVGYDWILGRPKENVGPNNLSDRDQFTFTLTWYFI